MQCLIISKMSQKYDNIAETLEYLIHKHFLFQMMTQTPHFHAKTTELLNYNNCYCHALQTSGVYIFWEEVGWVARRRVSLLQLSPHPE